jgi:hypothetical protein
MIFVMEISKIHFCRGFNFRSVKNNNLIYECSKLLALAGSYDCQISDSKVWGEPFEGGEGFLTNHRYSTVPETPKLTIELDQETAEVSSHPHNSPSPLQKEQRLDIHGNAQPFS